MAFPQASAAMVTIILMESGREEVWLPQGTVPTGGESEGMSSYLKDGGAWVLSVSYVEWRPMQFW